MTQRLTYIICIALPVSVGVALLCLLFLTGCSKDDDDDATPDTVATETTILETYRYTGDGVNQCTKYDPDDTCYLNSMQVDILSNDTIEVYIEWFHTTVSGAETVVADRYLTRTLPHDTAPTDVLLDRFVFRSAGDDSVLWMRISASPIYQPVATLITFEGDDLTRESLITIRGQVDLLKQ